MDIYLGGLTKEEWTEIVALDYIITWEYTDNLDKDIKRYIELSNKRWGIK